ncbi:hypothetical protein L8106_10267 [Lyngbya sp. PCC 8106]|nr:hypothetical protein L8106_10267 [Lyngbya sp. PCC 8106]
MSNRQHEDRGIGLVVNQQTQSISDPV